MTRSEINELSEVCGAAVLVALLAATFFVWMPVLALYGLARIAYRNLHRA